MQNRWQDKLLAGQFSAIIRQTDVDKSHIQQSPLVHEPIRANWKLSSNYTEKSRWPPNADSVMNIQKQLVILYAQYQHPTNIKFAMKGWTNIYTSQGLCEQKFKILVWTSPWLDYGQRICAKFRRLYNTRTHVEQWKLTAKV